MHSHARAWERENKRILNQGINLNSMAVTIQIPIVKN
jgi:hypothetical protein